MTRLLLTIALLALTGACGSEAPSAGAASVRVETTDWNGWDERAGPAPEVTTVEVSPGSTFEVDAFDGPLEFTVTEVGDARIELESDRELVAIGSGGGLDFDTATASFTLTGDEPLELGTPTMDAGTSVTLTVE